MVQRRLGSDIRDLYGRLIDGMRAERGRLRSGGDGGEMAALGSPPVEATLALFSGIVKVGPDGTANVEFQLPDFNGTVRLTAVAWSAGRVGSASKDTIVRDPVAMTVSAPRFLTLGDTARLELALHNIEGQAGTYILNGRYESEVGAQSAPSFERFITLGAGERSLARPGLRVGQAKIGRGQDFRKAVRAGRGQLGEAGDARGLQRFRDPRPDALDHRQVIRRRCRGCGIGHGRRRHRRDALRRCRRRCHGR